MCDPFYCEKLSAKMSLETCIKRHVSGKYLTCTGCALGAAHAGLTIEEVDLSHTCSRCGNQAQRLIGKRLCVSCYNREGEFVKGKDRRGNKPHIKLYLGTAIYTSNGQEKTYNKLAIGFSELLIDLVRLGASQVARVVTTLTPFQYDIFT